MEYNYKVPIGIIIGLTLFFTITYNRFGHQDGVNTYSIPNTEQTNNNKYQISPTSQKCGHICYECGKECEISSEMNSNGDISTNYVPYHLCGKKECLNLHLARINRTKIEQSNPQIEPYRNIQ